MILHFETEEILNQTEVVDLIIKTINTIFSNIFSSIDNSIYENLDKLAFINSDILSNTYFAKLLGSNGKTGLLLLADSFLFGFMIYYVVKFYYSNVVEIPIEKPSQFIFKVLIFAIFMNFSYFILEQILNISSLVTLAVQEIGSNITRNAVSFSELIVVLNKSLSINSEEFNIFSFDGIIKSFVTFGLVNLLLSYSLRYILLQVLLLLSPFAILSLISNSTSWFFKVWIKSLFSLIVIQIFVLLVIVVIFCIEASNKILFVGGVYALIKINGYVRELFGGLSVDVSSNFNSMMMLFRK